MKTLDLFIRCYAEKQGDLWIAACIDLCLAAQAYTLDEAVKKLDDQIFDYVTEALSEPAYAEDLLLNRKAPLSEVFKYHWIRAGLKFHIIKKTIAEACKKPIPMAPQRLSAHC